MDVAELMLAPRQPTHIRSSPASGFRARTLTHIPGTAVRGAYAAEWLARHDGRIAAHERREFVDLFEGGVIFGPLFAGRTPVPLSARVHKFDPTPSCERLVWDDAERSTTVVVCPSCQSPLVRSGPYDPIPGEYREPGSVLRTVDQKRAAVGIDGRRKTRGLSMREEILSDSAPFIGRLCGPANLLSILQDIPRLRIGGRRTIGGLMDATISARSYRAPEPLDSDRLVIRLVSPGIFVDDRGRAVTEPSNFDLERALGVPARVERKWVRWTQVGGWHIASGLPKHWERAVEAGSTYLVSTPQSISANALTRLALGLGLRRHEGFGAIAGANAASHLGNSSCREH